MKDYTLTPVDIEGLEKSYILESDNTDKLLLSPGRHLLGYERQKVAFAATVQWLEGMKHFGHLPQDNMELCTLTILAEGAGHNLPGALQTVLGEKEKYRGDNWLGVSRFALPESEAKPGLTYRDYDAHVKYVRINSPAPIWVVLDTVATGATLVRGLEAAFANAPRPKRILMGTPAGSPVGMRKLQALCNNAGVEFVSTFFAAAFALHEDGSGLPWCHPETILSGSLRSQGNIRRAEKRFNLNPAFCSVGDCSANFFDVSAALDHLKQEEERLGWSLPRD